MNITFRLETPADHYAVEAMTREAFWQFWETDRTVCDEHLLVSKLRTCSSFVPELKKTASRKYEKKINLLLLSTNIL